MLTVLCYIHQNPVKSGLTGRVEGYRWSSYEAYINGGRFIDSECVLNILSPERGKAIAAFKKHMEEQIDERCLDIDVATKRTDQEVMHIIQNLANIRVPAELQNFEKGKRNEILRSIKALSGVSTWQLARLTGLSQTVIARA